MRPLSMIASILDVSSLWSCAPGVSRTQCTGHTPPWVAMPRGARSASSFTRSMISSPSGTASAPPGQKSFWTSTMIKASIPRHYSRAMPLTLESTREDLQRVLLSPEDAMALDVRGRTVAAVLVPLYLEGDELHAVF